MGYVQHDGVKINGTVEHVMPDPPELQMRRVKYWALIGETALLGQRGGRFISIRFVAHDAHATFAALYNDLRIWTDLVGRAGLTKVNETNIGYSFANMVYLGWEPSQDPADGPLKDVGGTLDGGWWQRIELRFWQTRNKT